MPRSFIGISLAAIMALAATAASAQDFPTRSIKIVQGFAPGGNADAISRVLADEMQKGLGQSVTVESRPGAGGNLGTAEVVKANPDGYTLLLFTTGHVISAALYKSLPFDPVNDLQFLTTVSELPHFIVVNTSKSPHKTIQSLIDAAKAKPGSVTFGTAGIGTGQHLGAELLNASIAGKMVHVPYRGDSAAVTGLLSGDVDFIVAPLPAVQGNLDAGTFTALAQTWGKPWPTRPNVPPVASVIPGFEVLAWTGVATTKGVPAPIVAKLNAELRRVIALPNVAQKLRDFGGEPGSSTPEEATNKTRNAIATFAKVIADANIPKQ